MADAGDAPVYVGSHPFVILECNRSPEPWRLALEEAFGDHLYITEIGPTFITDPIYHESLLTWLLAGQDGVQVYVM